MLFNITNPKKVVQFFCTLILCIALFGCASSGASSKSKGGSDKTQISNENQQKHYNRAVRKLNAKNYPDALSIYNEFIVKYPFGTLSERARLERIFVLNKLNAAAEATVSIDRFIAQHPLHPNLDYAYYMRGVVAFEKKRKDIFQRFAGAKQIYRNKINYESSHQSFAELLQEFPDSRYASDAKKRMNFLRNNMAVFELSVAKFYAERNAHIGAIQRTKFIVENYDQAPAVIDALELMVKSYEKIGLADKADEARLLLATNYSDIDGVKSRYKSKTRKSWLRLPNLNPLRLFTKNS